VSHIRDKINSMRQLSDDRTTDLHKDICETATALSHEQSHSDILFATSKSKLIDDHFSHVTKTSSHSMVGMQASKWAPGTVRVGSRKSSEAVASNTPLAMDNSARTIGNKGKATARTVDLSSTLPSRRSGPHVSK
jgi:hypothetical protein